MTSSQPGSVLQARRTGLPVRYEITAGDADLASVSARTARRGGHLDVLGQTYEIERTGLTGQYRLQTPDAHTVAVATRNRPTGWDVEVAGGRMLRLKSASLGGDEVLLDASDREVGTIRRISHGVEADLPGLDQPTQVFIVLVTLAARQRRRRVVLLGR